jgi:hypothetical protein
MSDKLVRRLVELRAMSYEQYLQTPEWKDRRRDAIYAADRRCQLCNAEGTLHVHHRDYTRRGAELPSDLTVLCQSCHEKHHDIPSTAFTYSVYANEAKFLEVYATSHGIAIERAMSRWYGLRDMNSQAVDWPEDEYQARQALLLQNVELFRTTHAVTEGRRGVCSDCALTITPGDSLCCAWNPSNPKPTTPDDWCGCWEAK